MRSLRTAACVLVAALGAAGCSTRIPAAPTTSPTPTVTPLPAPTALPRSTAVTNGLTVRYRDDDGQLKTLHVEDFPR